MTITNNKLDILTDKSLDIAAQFLTWLQEIGVNSSTTLESEIPIFVKELINWFIWQNAITVVLSSLIIIILLFCAYKCFKLADATNDENVGVFSMLLIAVVIVLSLVVLTPSTIALTKSIVAPRVCLGEWIIEQSHKLRK